MTAIDSMLLAAKECERLHGKILLVVDFEIYEFFGETVSIVEMTSTVGPRVIIESQLGDRHELDLSELKLGRARGER